MSAPKVTVVTEGSPAAVAGFVVGDELVSLNGRQPRDVIEYQQLVDTDELEIIVRRPVAGGPRRAADQAGADAGAGAGAHDGAAIGSSGDADGGAEDGNGGSEARVLTVRKEAGEPLGIEVSSAVFDRIRTCDNHCAFCFIYQLPKGMRRSLYVKDDDYRLSFLYGNFTTLTRFTELDAERVVDERLGPLFVSIHATDPDVRSQMLRNPKGATSLRWLRFLLDVGIEVHGQVVVCPGVNDGPVLTDTFTGILDEYAGLASVGVVPLGLSRYSSEPTMRPHTVDEAAAVCDEVARWQAIYESVLGRRLVYASDEYYLLAGRPLPPAGDYDGFPQHENGIGMIRAFERAFGGDRAAVDGVRHGFFAAVDGAPAAGYRAPRVTGEGTATDGGVTATNRPGGAVGGDRRSGLPVTVVTGTYGARVLAPLLSARPDVEILTVPNDFFGGNIGVAGLLTGEDLARALAGQPDGRRYLIPDACLSEDRFLDGLTLADLPRPVEVVPTDGRSLRAALDGQLVPAGGAGCGAGNGAIADAAARPTPVVLR
jgi:NifB/MoaA-like Fe-S oxidoreductase